MVPKVQVLSGGLHPGRQVTKGVAACLSLKDAGSIRPRGSPQHGEHEHAIMQRALVEPAMSKY